MNTQTRHKLVIDIIHYIRNRTDFLENLSLDYADLLDYPISSFLHDIGIDIILSEEELSLISEEIKRIAEETQTSEINSIIQG